MITFLKPEEQHQHKNGGGWVANTVTIDDSVYVAPNARVYGDARVYGNAWVYGDARVYGNAWVYGDAQVYGDARVYGNIHLKFGNFVVECKASLKVVVACSLNVFPISGSYTLYKRVKKISKGKYVSLHDEKFFYYDKKVATAKNPDMTWENSCSSGLHASTPFYAGNEETLIAVKVALEDVITCQEGKVRCKTLTVIGEVDEA